jgi:putative transposase
MLNIIWLCLGTIVRLFCARHKLVLENLALRQQLAVFKRWHPRPRLDAFDKLFWIAARQVWSDWKQPLIIVLPDTVVRWHRAGFKLYWRILSKACRQLGGRHRISKEIQDLIFQMVAENPTWGAPRIHGELLMLGFDVSERTISRWMRKAPRDPQLVSDGSRFCVINQKATRGELLARFYWEQMSLAQIANFSGRLRVSQLNGYDDRV